MGKTIEKVSRAIESAKRVAKNSESVSRIEGIEIFSSYSEPGYTLPESGIVAVGNWNNVDRYNAKTKARETTCWAVERLAKVLERLGVELEWSDEWTSCDDCRGLVRTQADSYGWEPAFTTDGDSGVVCLKCKPQIRFAVDIERVTWERFYIVAESAEAAAQLLRDTSAMDRAEKFAIGTTWDEEDGGVQVRTFEDDGETVDDEIVFED